MVSLRTLNEITPNVERCCVLIPAGSRSSLLWGRNFLTSFGCFESFLSIGDLLSARIRRYDRFKKWRQTPTGLPTSCRNIHSHLPSSLLSCMVLGDGSSSFGRVARAELQVLVSLRVKQCGISPEGRIFVCSLHPSHVTLGGADCSKQAALLS